MNTNYTAMALIVDRSGSMHSIASDVKGSVKQLIGDQKKNDGKASVTVSQFDDRYEVVYDFKDIKEIDEAKFAQQYSPRGSTALLDAIGRSTLALSQKLESIPAAERPNRVVVAVITDGQENASSEYQLDQIKKMIKDKTALGWDFIFMGATLDTIEVAKNMGFSVDKSACYATSKFSSCMQSVSEQITKARLNKEVKISEEERTHLTSSAA